MATIQIFVEDELNEAYEHLAAKALGIDQPRRRSHGKNVRVSRIKINEFVDSESLFDLTRLASKSGASQVFFVLDDEDHHVSPERITLQRQFRQAFGTLCREIGGLPTSNLMRQTRVVRVVCKTCLECWLLADPKAVVEAAGGDRSYLPKIGVTETLTPRQARDQIAHIFNEVNRRRRRKKRVSSRSMKSEGAKIARYVSLEEAYSNNYSLAYFRDMLTGGKDGCKYAFPHYD